MSVPIESGGQYLVSHRARPQARLTLLLYESDRNALDPHPDTGECSAPMVGGEVTKHNG